MMSGGSETRRLKTSAATRLPAVPSAWKWRAGSLLMLLAAWTLAAMWLDATSLPPPWTVAREIYARTASGELPFHAVTTLYRAVLAFLVAMLFGAAAGILLGRFRALDRFFDTWLIVGLNIPALVVIILFYVWFGLNEFAAIAAVVVNKAPVVAVIMREGARAVRQDLLAVGETFRLSRRRRFLRIYLPQLYPQLAATAHSVFALTWKIVLVVELLGRPDGVGFQLRRFFNFFDISAVLAYTVVFAALVFLIELSVLQPMERHANRWRHS